MLLQLTELSEEPLYKQLTRQLADRILSGELVRGSVLPPSSKMARAHRVNMNAVRRAYEELEKDGLITRNAGNEAVVTSLTPEQKRILATKGSLTHNSPLSVVAILSKQLTLASEPDEMKEILRNTLKKFFSTRSVHITLRDNQKDACLIQPSERYPETFLIEECDPVLQKIRQAEAILELRTLSVSLNESNLLWELVRRKVSLLVPLIEAGQFIGFVALTDKITEAPYSKEELSLISVLASQFAIAYTGASYYSEAMEKRRMDKDLAKARQIQRGLLPKELPVNGRFSMAAHCVPSRVVGGDIYDYIPMDEKHFGLVIADACGNGLPAAILISQTQAILKSELNNGKEIQRVFENTNRQIVQSTPKDKFVTLLFGVFNKETGGFEYTNAGHHYPILMRKNGRCERLQEGGLALGMFPDATYEIGQVILEEGDILFLFTDGLTEAMDSTCNEYGEQRLVHILHRYRYQSPEEILKKVVNDVGEFCGSNLRQDDCTILILKIGEL